MVCLWRLWFDCRIRSHCVGWKGRAKRIRWFFFFFNFICKTKRKGNGGKGRWGIRIWWSTVRWVVMRCVDGMRCDAIRCDAMRSNWQKMKKHLIEIVLNEHGWVIANMKHDDLNNTCINYYRDIINKLVYINWYTFDKCSCWYWYLSIFYEFLCLVC